MIKESFGCKRISSSEYIVEKYIFSGSLCVRPDSKKQQKTHKQTKTHHDHHHQQNQETKTNNNNNNKIDSNMSHEMITSSCKN